MKLLTRTTLYYFFICIPLLVIAAICSYFLINYELEESIDEALTNELPIVEKIIDSWKEPRTLYISADSLSVIKPAVTQNSSSGFSDTSIYKINEPENFRVLNSYYNNNGFTYQITIYKTTIEKDELMEGLLFSFVLIFAFLLFTFFYINRILSKKLWKPFYQTLDDLNKYDIKMHNPQKFASVNTLEFDQLNRDLNKMTEKIHTDFLQLKEFTENASHEMQTPLAVAKANLSLLLQSPHLQEAEMDQLQMLENTIKKLASLHKTLMLLAKIENNQYADTSTIYLKKIVLHNLEQYADFIEAKNIQLHLELDHEVQTRMDPALADILISNLIQNAIRHNTEQGEIYIRSADNQLCFSNTGHPLTLQQDELFLRFKKEDTSSSSLGLGLAIVKSIVSLYDFEVTYSYTAATNLHNFTLKV